MFEFEVNSILSAFQIRLVILVPYVMNYDGTKIVPSGNKYSTENETCSQI